VTANTGGGRSGKDANTVLASIHTFDAAAGCDATTFQPCSDRALANLLTYVNAFRSIYTINSGIATNQGCATGRYPEDVYFNGNVRFSFGMIHVQVLIHLLQPWYLATLAVAEQLYDSLIVWKQQNFLAVTATSQPFFDVFSPGIATGTYVSSTSTYTTLIAAIQNYADGFVAVVAKYTPTGGGLSEQYSRDDGSPLSAVDLTWSYAALLTASDTRQGIVPASWGAKGLTVPSSCSASVTVNFNVQATTVYGGMFESTSNHTDPDETAENIYLTGSVSALMNWSPDNALLLSSTNYPIWSSKSGVI
jgi:glucoamylase